MTTRPTASVTTDPEALAEAIRVIDKLPVKVTIASLSFEGDCFVFCRDSDETWYLSEVY